MDEFKTDLVKFLTYAGGGILTLICMICLFYLLRKIHLYGTDEIFVNRQVKATPPHECEFLHPELQNVGPSKYHLSEVRLYRTSQQVAGQSYGVSFEDDYIHVRDRGYLHVCLGVLDAEAIQYKGPAYFKNAFGANTVLVFWKSTVVEYRGYRKDEKHILAPILCLNVHGELVLRYTDSFGNYANYAMPFIQPL